MRERSEWLRAQLASAPMLPLLVIERREDAVPLARALVLGGLRVMEVALRTEAALSAIAAIAKDVPQAIVGAGTVLSAADLTAAGDAGARFAVSPGATEKLLAVAREHHIPLLTGVATASEAMLAASFGYRCLKFFPAEAAGGPAMLQALAGPFPALEFCPTGGITAARAPDYARLSNVVCVGGSWVTPADAIKAGDWTRVEHLAAGAARIKSSSGDVASL